MKTTVACLAVSCALVALTFGCGKPKTEPPPPVRANVTTPAPQATPANEEAPAANAAAEETAPPAATEKPAPTSEKPKKLTKVSAKSWKPYKGAWFNIKYPESFKVAERQKSATASEGQDGVSFISPDGKVEFYVFSPQWSGSPEWIELQAGEKVANRESEQKGSQITEQVMISGPGYERAYVDVKNPEQNTRHVFGIKYANKDAYKAYHEAYMKFKESLEQFAD